MWTKWLLWRISGRPTPQPPGCWGLPVTFAVYRQWEDAGHGQRRGWAATRLLLFLPCAGTAVLGGED